MTVLQNSTFWSAHFLKTKTPLWLLFIGCDVVLLVRGVRQLSHLDYLLEVPGVDPSWM